MFARRGVDAWVFRGDDGLDELTTTTTSSVWVVHGGEVADGHGRPGGPRPRRVAPPEDLRGGDAAHNAEVVRRLLAGEPGPVRDAVLLNAGAALAVYARPGGDVDDQLAAGLDRARDALDSGAAAATLERWVAASSEVEHVGVALAAEAHRRRSTARPSPGGVTTQVNPRSLSRPLRRQTNSPGEKSRNRGVT